MATPVVATIKIKTMTRPTEKAQKVIKASHAVMTMPEDSLSSAAVEI